MIWSGLGQMLGNPSVFKYAKRENVVCKKMSNNCWYNVHEGKKILKKITRLGSETPWHLKVAEFDIPVFYRKSSLIMLQPSSLLRRSQVARWPEHKRIPTAKQRRGTTSQKIQNHLRDNSVES